MAAVTSALICSAICNPSIVGGARDPDWTLDRLRTRSATARATGDAGDHADQDAADAEHGRERRGRARIGADSAGVAAAVAVAFGVGVPVAVGVAAGVTLGWAVPVISAANVNGISARGGVL